MFPLPLSEWCQRKSAKAEGLNKIQSLIKKKIPQISRLPLKITDHVKAWEKLNLKVKIYSIDPNTEITEVLQLSEKDSKIIIINMLQQAPLKQMKKIESLRKELEDVIKK